MRTVKTTFGGAKRKDFLSSLRAAGLTSTTSGADTPGPAQYDTILSALEVDEKRLKQLLHMDGKPECLVGGEQITKRPHRAPPPSKTSRLGYTTSATGGKGIRGVEMRDVMRATDSPRMTARSREIIQCGIYNSLSIPVIEQNQKAFTASYNRTRDGLVKLLQERALREGDMPVLPAANELHKIFSGLRPAPSMPSMQTTKEMLGKNATATSKSDK